jgi:hypothetical protein
MRKGSLRARARCDWTRTFLNGGFAPSGRAPPFRQRSERDQKQSMISRTFAMANAA